MDSRACCRFRNLAPATMLGAAAGSAILAGLIGLLLALKTEGCWRCRAVSGRRGQAPGRAERWR